MIRTASLPVYNIAELKEANAAFWSALQNRIQEKGLEVRDIVFQPNNPLVPEGTGQNVFFSQVCGYPLFKCFRDQYRLLAVPSYGLPGCTAGMHRAFFLIRDDYAATTLQDMRGSIFGCNSLLSNSGMNLPRLDLARLAGGLPLFSSVRISGSHATSLEWLADKKIDLCSVDCVTWGHFEKYRPQAAHHFRILAETAPSPAIPFVTSAQTSDAEAAALVETLYDMMGDSALRGTLEMLDLIGVGPPDIAAYEHLAEFELDAKQRGYPEIC